jgi:hypothetical protein
MKITDYFASASSSTQNSNLDKWQTFRRQTDTTFTTAGQLAPLRQRLTTDAGTVGVSVGGLLTGTTTTAVAIPQNATLLINGAYYSYTTAGIAAGAALSGTLNPVPGVAVIGAASADCFLITNQGTQYGAWVGANTLDTVTIKAHGISIYDNFPSKFFNAYTSYHYGGPNINTPNDQGLVFIPKLSARFTIYLHNMGKHIKIIC